MSTPSEAPKARQSGLFDTVRAVLWAFLGVRRRSDYQRDIERLNPLHLLAVGLVLALMFVGGLMLLVRWVVGG